MPRNPAHNRWQFLTVRLSHGLMSALTDRADADGLQLSTFARQCIMDKLNCNADGTPRGRVITPMFSSTPPAAS